MAVRVLNAPSYQADPEHPLPPRGICHRRVGGSNRVPGLMGSESVEVSCDVTSRRAVFIGPAHASRGFSAFSFSVLGTEENSFLRRPPQRVRAMNPPIS